jgi:Bacterial membrane protein YfhO
VIVSSGESATNVSSPGLFERRRWGYSDLVALLVWTAAIAGFFWDAVSLRKALFYFDVTEINYPYRAFFADELRAGRFSRWCPGLYCGLPLYSESQAGYLHPFKYLLYPWLATWQALNLDTVLSIWLTGVGAFFWLRRHVGPAGALTGACILGLSGFTWGHLIHTSMINALASLPFVIWGLEHSWASGRRRGVALAGVALACQVFAGHLQDALWTICLVGLYGLYRASTENSWHRRMSVLGMAAALVIVGVLLSAVQWIPSKELLDRSPRASGLSWDNLTFGSWHPELLPTAVIREAFGTRARDTDWMDGFYPYHEMNIYVGLIAIVLAVVGAKVHGARDRWANFWVVLIGIALVLMLGRFTCLFDYAHFIPILGSSREPVRFQIWAAVGIAALAAVGVERLEQGDGVSLHQGLVVAGSLVLFSIPILCFLYAPAWSGLWNKPRQLAQFRWLGHEFVFGLVRTLLLSAMAWWAAWKATRSADPSRRLRWVAVLPTLVIADLLGSHWADVPTVDPSFWTDPPESVGRLKSDPNLIRIFGIADKSAAEPGYASEPVDFLAARDQLDWSLAPVWHIPSARGETPMRARRSVDFFDYGGRRLIDVASITHVLTGRRNVEKMRKVLNARAVVSGSAFILRNVRALPRARLAGRPLYAEDRQHAVAALARSAATDELQERLIVEDPLHSLPTDAAVSGTARIIEDLPERMVIETEASTPAYLVVSDTFDPGWSAQVDGRPAMIHPAYITFRAVYLDHGKHTVVLTYRPAGFSFGLELSLCGFLGGLGLVLWPRGATALTPEHSALRWPSRWRTWWFSFLAAIVIVSAIGIGPKGWPALHSRWHRSVHPFTWDSGYLAIRNSPQMATPDQP